MTQFVKDKPKLCTQILQNHITSNTEEQKRTFIRSMQTVGVFDDDEDSDEYLDADEVIYSPIVNKIDLDDQSISCQQE